MDDIAHILWSIVIYYHYDWWIAAIFGILPDLLVFIPFYIKRFMSGRIKTLQDTKPHGNLLYYDRWVQPWYHWTHSWVFVAVIIGGCSLIFGYRIEYWAMLIHVLVDIPSHEKKWFGAKPLYPFSNWQLNGSSWATRDFMLANYTCIALAFGIRLFGM